ncbi:MAG: hypothetical protein ACRD1L_11910 [Terriglobales bacterium]
MQDAVARTRNKGYYRVLHVPLWIWVFFTLPGGLTAELYAHGFNRRHAVWLAVVAAVCVGRGARGRLPGAEARPYITHYGLELPNLGYRVVCYTAAWIAIVAPWTLNLAGLLYAAAGGGWIVTSLYGLPYDLVAAAVVAVGALDRLPRAGRSIRNEGAERGWFYLGVWTAVISQLAAWGMWRLGPRLDLAPGALLEARLGVFLGVSAAVAALGLAGRLPRTERYHVPVGAAQLPAARGE